MKDDNLIQEILRNESILNSCSKHSFTVDLTPDLSTGKRWQCTNCKGNVDTLTKFWYEKGIADSSN